MASSKGVKIAILLLRVIIIILLFISLLVLATNSKTVVENTVRFHDVYGYRYTMATIIIGGALNLLQIAFTLYHVITKGDGFLLFDMFADKMLSYLLLSGAAAGLGAGIDLKANFNDLGGHFLDSFFDKGNGAAALVFIAFLCSAIVSTLTSLALIKKP